MGSPTFVSCLSMFTFFVSFSLPFLGVFQDTIDDNLSHTEPVIQVTFTPCQSTVDFLLPTNIICSPEYFRKELFEPSVLYASSITSKTTVELLMEYKVKEKIM